MCSVLTLTAQHHSRGVGRSKEKNSSSDGWRWQRSGNGEASAAVVEFRVDANGFLTADPDKGECLSTRWSGETKGDTEMLANTETGKQRSVTFVLRHDQLGS